MLQNDWLSLHVFLSDPRQSLRFFDEWLSPYTRALMQKDTIGKWFFIRYWDGGPHLRLRFLLNEAPVSETIYQDLSAAAIDFKAETPITREAYYGSHKFDGEAPDIETLPWFDEGSVVAITYNPETIRYGGDKALAVNERLFHVSSEIALRLCLPRDRSMQQHLAAAMMLMATSFLAYDNENENGFHFFNTYAEYWRSYSDDAAKAEQSAGSDADPHLLGTINRLRASFSGDKPKSAEHIWGDQVQQAVTAFAEIFNDGELVLPLTGEVAKSEEDHVTAVSLILSSQVHMMNNRLGVLPAQECYLARKLANAFRELAA